jgi:hypothetical protein
VQVFPGVDAGVVQIVEGEADGVIADRFDADDADVAAAGDGLFLIGAVALDFGARAFDAEVFGGEHEVAAVVEGDLELFLGAVEVDVCGRGHGVQDSRGRASSGSMMGMPSRIG